MGKIGEWVGEIGSIWGNSNKNHGKFVRKRVLRTVEIANHKSKIIRVSPNDF